MTWQTNTWFLLLVTSYPYDVAIAIFSVSTQRKEQLRTKTIHLYYLALVDAWTKSSGNGHQ